MVESANWYTHTNSSVSTEGSIKRFQKNEFNAELNYMAGDEIKIKNKHILVRRED